MRPSRLRLRPFNLGGRHFTMGRGWRGMVAATSVAPTGVSATGLSPSRLATRRFKLSVQIHVVVTRDVTVLLGTNDLFVKLLDDPLLNHLAASRVDRMRDVGVEFGTTI